ncbi:hypothetical protein H4S02_002564 [Coemansia sp. RSA 2611]|nr:hypothetical protein H4S01_000733 [Coemansia sp. RSA 2610]KAJ2389041.1 hypothetical protein H4S02_002564 [Coemansia sp. RSA 2611]
MRPLAASVTASMSVRLNSTAAVTVPEDLRPQAVELADGKIKTLLGEFDVNAPPANIRPELWTMYVAMLRRMTPGVVWQLKQRSLNWILFHAQNREELDMAFTMAEQWRARPLPITQTTTLLWVRACIRAKYPEIFMKMLLDRWKYRQMPVSLTLAHFIRSLGSLAAESGSDAEKLLDDAFRVFALYPYYDIAYDADAYGALVEACCEINTDEAWRRALLASEETLAHETPMITLEALRALERRSTERGESEMAERYGSLAKRSDIPAAGKLPAEYDEYGLPTVAFD